MAWKFQTFAKDYKEGITLAYYCSSLLLTIALFGIGTVYLWHRDRRDQLRREREDRRDHQRREWRQFAERIYSEYSKLRSESILQKVLTVKSTFENIRIHSEVTGLDVLRYMLADFNCQNFVSESPQLKALHEDLHTIVFPLNTCASLLLLGEVPENIKEELRHVVDELGNVAKPFFTGGHERRIVLKCLQHFGSGRSNDETERTERRVSRLDSQLETIVPYVNILQFGGTNLIQKEQQGFSPKPANLYGGFQGGTSKTELLNTPGYNQCSKFSLNVKVNNLDNKLNITFLEELHKGLEDPKYMIDFARNFKEQQALPLQSIEQISDSDSDESVLMKMLHEVRVYIHLFLNEDPNENERVQSNMNILRQVYKEVKEFRSSTEKVVKENCSRIIEDLERIRTCPPYHCNNLEFCEKLKQLHGRLCEIQIIPRPQSENNQETSETTL